MKKEVGNKDFAIWLLGDSNPKHWEDVLETPLDPRHPARHSIWTPLLDVIQDRIFRACRRRVDTSMIYIRNAVEDPDNKPRDNIVAWPDLVYLVEEFGELLQEYRPGLLLCFGAFSFEFARRSLKLKPERAFRDWGARTLGEQFRSSIGEFEPTRVNVLPLLHTSISRGRFKESHDYFSGQEGGNYFEFAGNAIAGKLMQYQSALRIWIE
ncbi:MAG: hypothetical protein FJ011_27490 [Chloroflexi bacterium]|nr:hypothetical protein [Chloroflexota bacterium]